MSSVSRYARQIPLATTYYDANTVVSSPSTLVFEFVPSSSNYVGNYPNGFNDTTGGYVISATTNLVSAINQAVTAAGGTVGSSAGTLVLRDMGKTIFAPVGTVSGVTPTAPSTTAPAPYWGYYRQVQLINPAAITQGPGFMGGVTGNTFGVLGAANVPDIYTDYLTFYIPVSVAGIAGCNSSGVALSAKAYALAGGQM
jgi:hypothetical protein